MQRTAQLALRITLIYTVFGLLWITLSDRVLNSLINDPDLLASAQLIKGWGFIGLTALLLYFLSVRALTTYQQAFESDPLTKLLRHDRFKLLLSQQLQHLSPDQSYVLVYFDIDHFSEINKTVGHDKADIIIQRLAKHLRSRFAIEALLARLAVDQFAVASVADHGEQKVEQVYERIMSILQQLSIESGCELKATYGVALAPQDAKHAKGLMWSASEALRLGKQRNRTQINFFNPDLSAQQMQAIKLSRDLRFALENEQLTLAYQPQFNMHKQVTGVEVLVRWHHPEEGPISPALFVPLAEHYGLIDKLTSFVIRQSYSELTPFLGRQLSRVSVNTSAAEINNAALIDKLEHVVSSLPDYSQYLQLEVTETAALENLEFARSQMVRLGRLGLRFSLDDFGTGYSSLSMIKELPLHELKIDRSFISSMLNEHGARTIVESVINIAKGYKLVVVAEGVEHEEEFALLASLGCSEVQGYLLAKPMPIDALQQLLT
ncbi:putative bifunctional diguanylate cyclase/phosphodiesterase [Salinibius halmophilus]|uniref:putative bifunctional diguanylate cyclase/phosphodiesterase n=1 Tax=Salinibius halmophilus TaxID=1853216 RepID=UPI000E6633CA|nr:bifunctional diguanylate cyclase/phosphodiesterase [Salinibius halmophilus]